MTINGDDHLRNLGSKSSEANDEKVISSANVSDLHSTGSQPAKRKTTPSSKERKKRYVKALERAVQNLRIQSTSLSAQLQLSHEDTNCLTTKRTELKLSMQSIENKVHLQKARNDALRKEIQELRELIHQSIQNEAPTMSVSWSSGEYQQFVPQNQQFQNEKQEIKDLDIWSPMLSPSSSAESLNLSPSKEITQASYDYRLF